MTKWTSDQLEKIGRAEELQIAPVGLDGKLRKPVTVWVVRHGDDLYVRSVKGRVDAGRDIDDEVDAAYRAKYRRYAGNILNSVLTPEARSTTIKLVPRS